MRPALLRVRGGGRRQTEDSVMLRVLIVGGSGFIGRHVAGRLDTQGHAVVAPSRRTLDLVRDDEAQMREALAGFDVVVNCAGVARGATISRLHGGGTIALIRAAAATGVKRFVHVSALGVTNRGDTIYQRSKAAAEDFLESFDPAGARLDWRVLRPSVVIGRGGASFDLQLALAALPVIPSVGAGLWRIQPVHVDDLAELVARLVEGAAGPRKIDVVGPAPITTNDLSLILRDWLGLPRAKFWSVPTPLLKLGARFAGTFTRLPLNAELVSMLSRGNVSDPAPMTAALGRSPRALKQALAVEPACDADRTAARLYFVRPLLRWSLALLWIASGVLSFGLYPVEKSYEILRLLNFSGALAAATLYGAAAIDLSLGLLLLLRWRTTAVGVAQLLVMSVFTLLAIGLPADYWLHPFAPLLKNLPLAAATLVMIALES